MRPAWRRSRKDSTPKSGWPEEVRIRTQPGPRDPVKTSAVGLKATRSSLGMPSGAARTSEACRSTQAALPRRLPMPPATALRPSDTDDPTAARSRRAPHGNIPPPALGPNQQEVGDVGAGDQKDDSHGAQKIQSGLAMSPTSASSSDLTTGRCCSMSRAYASVPPNRSGSRFARTPRLRRKIKHRFRVHSSHEKKTPGGLA